MKGGELQIAGYRMRVLVQELKRLGVEVRKMIYEMWWNKSDNGLGSRRMRDMDV